VLTAVLISVPLIVAAAAFWEFRQGVRKKYPVIAEAGRIEGIPALDAGNFDKAYQLLSAAKLAVNALDGEVEGANDIIQAANEAEIFVNLSPQLPEDMLEEAGRTDPDTWASKFNDLYKGRAVLIDSIITDVPTPGEPSRYMLGYVIVPPGGTNNFLNTREARPDRYAFIDLEGFELFERPPAQKGQRVIFGAKLASFEKNGDVWWVGLQPKSGVFITHSQALKAVGFPGADKVDLPPEPQPQ